MYNNLENYELYAFGLYSQREIAEGQEMNSGTIDTSVFSSVETSSGGLTT